MDAMVCVYVYSKNKSDSPIPRQEHLCVEASTGGEITNKIIVWEYFF